MSPFEVQIPQTAIDDLHARLDRVRWPDREVMGDDSQGLPLDTARLLIEHWRHRHDWRRFEARINRFPQFLLQIDGLDIHFLHVRSPHAGALPVILTHGWPGSVIEFLDTISPLADPVAHGGDAADAFDVVVPSIPGYGFSQRPAVAGWNAERTARAWGRLMQHLGYRHWVAQGGDWGSLVTHRLAQLRPAGLAAAHVNLPLVFPAADPARPSEDERQAIESMARFQASGGAYAAQQGTRPQTLGYGLADSPVAQAAWMFEKIDAWSGNDGSAQPALGFDTILYDISLYWFTNSGASSARFYWEVFQTGFGRYSAGRIDLPMGATIFPGEFYRAPRIWAEREWTNLFYWNTARRGGHFAAWEQPAIFVDEVRKAFRGFR